MQYFFFWGKKCPRTTLLQIKRCPKKRHTHRAKYAPKTVQRKKYLRNGTGIEKMLKITGTVIFCLGWRADSRNDRHTESDVQETFICLRLKKFRF